MTLMPLSMMAQRNDREYVRKGNKLYSDSLFVKAEENYLKALDKNQESLEAMYNLGNAYLNQQKAQEAVEQYRKSASAFLHERDRVINDKKSTTKEIADIKEKTAEAFHNLGVVMQASQNYQEAVSAYQESLRNNPSDQETRYNLALAMHQLKQQQNEDQQDQQDQNQQDKQDQQDKQNQQDQQNNDQQQEPQQDEQNQQQSMQDRQEMSRENAEQLLDAAMQDEKEVQERVQQMMQVQSKGKLDKDW